MKIHSEFKIKKSTFFNMCGMKCILCVDLFTVWAKILIFLFLNSTTNSLETLEAVAIPCLRLLLLLFIVSWLIADHVAVWIWYPHTVCIALIYNIDILSYFNSVFLLNRHYKIPWRTALFLFTLKKEPLVWQKVYNIMFFWIH